MLKIKVNSYNTIVIKKGSIFLQCKIMIDHIPFPKEHLFSKALKNIKVLWNFYNYLLLFITLFIHMYIYIYVCINKKSTGMYFIRRHAIQCKETFLNV